MTPARSPELRRARVVALVTAVVVLGGVVLLGGCSSAGSAAGPSTTTVPPQSGTVVVQALDNRFEEKDITITAGSTVTWRNDGANRHDVVPAEGAAYGVRPENFGPDQSYSTTFSDPGTYAYYCTLHGSATRGMIGSVTVVAP